MIARILTAFLIGALGTASAGPGVLGQSADRADGSGLAASCTLESLNARAALMPASSDPNLELRLARALASCRRYPEAIARYRRAMATLREDEKLDVELGEVLFRSGQADEASHWFRRAMRLDAADPSAAIGLARTLAAAGSFPEALLRYNQALEVQPGNFDAQQGKADILYWTCHFEEAARILERLRARDPGNVEIAHAIEAVHRAIRAAQPARPGAPGEELPATTVARDELALQQDPDDVAALEELARLKAQSGDFKAAIAAYARVVAGHPGDQGARLQLARLLGWNRQYDEAARAFRSVLAEARDDREALEGLAGVQISSGNLSDAAATYGHLASEHPGETNYLLETARIEAELHQYASARDRLATHLAERPEDSDARLMLAQLELKQAQYPSSLRQFDRVLESRPRDASARMGAAQALYYMGDLARADTQARQLVQQEPANFDALFLLASIERARGHRDEARALLRRASRLSRRSPEVAGLRRELWKESSTVLHLTAAYSRETGTPAGPWVQPNLAVEDLRTLTLGSQLDFVWLPRSTSSLSFDAVPTKNRTDFSPAITSNAFLYRQTTRLTSKLSLRGGIGVERFGGTGSVEFKSSPLQIGAGPQLSAGATPVGFAGVSFSPETHASLDFTVSRSAVAYTPLAARLGVVSNRKEAGLNIDLDPLTAVHLSYFKDVLSTERYWHLSNTVNAGTGRQLVVNGYDREQGSGGTLELTRRLFSGERLRLDAGLSAMALGYDGPRHGLYFGFFTPSFYQRELLNTRLSGSITSRLGYSLASGFGVQQVNQGRPLKRAFSVAPSFDLKLTPYLSTSLGYTRYDSTQSLGTVTGNGVRLGIDWRF